MALGVRCASWHCTDCSSVAIVEGVLCDAPHDATATVAHNDVFVAAEAEIVWGGVALARMAFTPHARHHLAAPAHARASTSSQHVLL